MHYSFPFRQSRPGSPWKWDCLEEHNVKDDFRYEQFLLIALPRVCISRRCFRRGAQAHLLQRSNARPSRAIIVVNDDKPNNNKSAFCKDRRLGKKYSCCSALEGVCACHWTCHGSRPTPPLFQFQFRIETASHFQKHITLKPTPDGCMHPLKPFSTTKSIFSSNSIYASSGQTGRLPPLPRLQTHTVFTRTLDAELNQLRADAF